jgi:hypothetical protein
VFKKPLEVKLWQTTLVVEFAMRLHNYCIDKCDNIVTSIGGINPEALVLNYKEHLEPLIMTVLQNVNGMLFMKQSQDKTFDL